jgi:hypothetical protein
VESTPLRLPVLHFTSNTSFSCIHPPSTSRIKSPFIMHTKDADALMAENRIHALTIYLPFPSLPPSLPSSTIPYSRDDQQHSPSRAFTDHISKPHESQLEVKPQGNNVSPFLLLLSSPSCQLINTHLPSLTITYSTSFLHPCLVRAVARTHSLTNSRYQSRSKIRTSSFGWCQETPQVQAWYRRP